MSSEEEKCSKLIINTIRKEDFRYPNLIAAIKREGILTSSEAIIAISTFKRGMSYCCEAVNHYGGARLLIRNAIKNRHLGRKNG